MRKEEVLAGLALVLPYINHRHDCIDWRSPAAPLDQPAVTQAMCDAGSWIAWGNGQCLPARAPPGCTWQTLVEMSDSHSY